MSGTDRKRKLIEVALPLDEINAACKADKDRKTGTIRNLHKWFAPMPLPAWRALVFAALVDDPEDDNQRVYLLDVIKRLVERGADLPDQGVLDEAKGVLTKQFADESPVVMDPFCGGGSTLVEAQRLGLRSYGSDLNPVPALISRTLTQLVPATFGLPPVRPSHDNAQVDHLVSVNDHDWSGYRGLAEDVAFYARTVGEQASERLASAFPRPQHERPVAWIWGRTADCENPACKSTTVLATTWWLSKKPGELAWVLPHAAAGNVTFEVVSGQRTGEPPAQSPRVGRGANFLCVACGALIDEKALIRQGKAGQIGYRLIAVAATVDGRRIYRAPVQGEEARGLALPETDVAAIDQPDNPRWFSGPRFGFRTFKDMYLPRQLRVLSTFAELVAALPERLREQGVDEDRALAIVSLLGLAVGQMAASGSTQTRWRLRTAAHAKAEGAFGRNDLPMNWDFAETYFESRSVGDWNDTCTSIIRALPYAPSGVGTVRRIDARSTQSPTPGLVATDPPYFDAIGYADLSDYFYMWHRQALRHVHPDLYTTIAAPKTGELTAVPSHHGNDRHAARQYFIEGFTETFRNLKGSIQDGLPMLVVYASKEQRAGDEETRWSSILTAMLAADLEITATWPIHGTGTTRMIGIGTNSIASYIVMACRPRPRSATSVSLSEFNRALRRELPARVRDLQASSVLPVDLPQAAMGPGMETFSRYRAVLNQTGQPIDVGQAMRLINGALGEVLEEQEGELDSESRFAVRWWEAHGWNAASFGEADKTARPLGIGVDDVRRAQVVTSQGNKVQLLGNGDLDPSWKPSDDIRPTAWGAVHHLAHRLIDRGGELEAARLMAVVGVLQDSAMALAYRLHDIAAKKGRTADQERYNALINSWAELIKLAGDPAAASEGLF